MFTLKGMTWTNNYKDTKAQMSSLLVFNRVYRLENWRYSQSCWYFRPLLWTSTPLTFSRIHPSLSPLPWVNKYRGMHFIGIYTVCNMGGGGDRVVWRTSTKVIHRFRTYKIALPPQKQKPWRRGGLTQINTAAKSFTGQFLRKSILTWSLLVIGPWHRQKHGKGEKDRNPRTWLWGLERGQNEKQKKNRNTDKMKSRKRTGTLIRWERCECGHGQDRQASLSYSWRGTPNFNGSAVGLSESVCIQLSSTPPLHLDSNFLSI